MSKLFQRVTRLQVGDFAINSGSQDVCAPILRFTFDVEKTLDSSPNRATISIYNLSETNRKKIQNKQFIRLDAGYQDSIEFLFSGDITASKITKESVDWVANIECGDGESKYASSRINKSFSAKTPIKAVLKEGFKTLGVDLGNTIDKINTTVLRKNVSQYANGAVLSGKTSKILDDLTASAGLQWSIQDNAVVLLKPDETTEDSVIDLNRESGLIGSPDYGETGIILVRSLLRGSIKPGRKIKIRAIGFDGFFKVLRVKHVGDTFGNEWYTDFEAKEV